MGSISKAVSRNIIKGYEDNKFRPDKDVSRAEVFTIIAKCLK
ncbi:MAG TPA: S-layer homology domain-containing protein [Pseudobacteroides sp.]